MIYEIQSLEEILNLRSVEDTYKRARDELKEAEAILFAWSLFEAALKGCFSNMLLSDSNPDEWQKTIVENIIVSQYENYPGKILSLLNIVGKAENIAFESLKSADFNAARACRNKIAHCFYIYRDMEIKTINPKFDFSKMLDAIWNAIQEIYDLYQELPQAMNEAIASEIAEQEWAEWQAEMMRD